jgi:hypothetical protein
MNFLINKPGSKVARIEAASVATAQDNAQNRPISLTNGKKARIRSHH